MAELSLKSIGKSFNETAVLKGIDLEIADGEFVVLVGPSGCGKSTLLRVISGLEEPTSGEIRIGGVPVTDVAPSDRDIAMVFQSYALYPHMSVRKNLSFSLRIRKMDKAEMDERIERAAKLLGIHALLDRLPKQLSGGQRQRVAMGRAIVRDPQVFLFDEPLSNLDASLRVQMRKEIKELHQRLRSTSIYVTHDQIEAMTMADRIVILRDGNIEQVGTPSELYARPENLFVAGFIGSPAMNFLDARIERRDGERVIVFGSASYPVPEGIEPEGDQVTLGVRPDAVSIARDGGGLSARVDLVEPTGRETVLECKVRDQTISVLTVEGVDCHPGAEVSLTLDISQAHLFDPYTGRRLRPGA